MNHFDEDWKVLPMGHERASPRHLEIVTESGQRVVTAGTVRGQEPEGTYFIGVVSIDPDDAELIAAAPEMRRALLQLNRAAKAVNNVQHAGMEVSPDMWANLWERTNAVDALLASLLPATQEGENT